MASRMSSLSLGIVLIVALVRPATADGSGTNVEERTWCYFQDSTIKINCGPGERIAVHNITLGDDYNCSLTDCCPHQVFCELPAKQLNLQLYNVLSTCHGKRSCNIHYYAIDDNDCSPGLDYRCFSCRTGMACVIQYYAKYYLQIRCHDGIDHYVDYIRFQYRCITPGQHPPSTTSTSAQPWPPKTPPTMTPVTTRPTMPDDGTPSLPVNYTAGPMTGENGKDTDNVVLIGVIVGVSCLILLTIIVVVICVKRQSRKSPSAAPTRPGAAPNVYTSPAEFQNSAFVAPTSSPPEVPFRSQELEPSAPPPQSPSPSPPTASPSRPIHPEHDVPELPPPRGGGVNRHVTTTPDADITRNNTGSSGQQPNYGHEAHDSYAVVVKETGGEDELKMAENLTYGYSSSYQQENTGNESDINEPMGNQEQNETRQENVDGGYDCDELTVRENALYN